MSGLMKRYSAVVMSIVLTTFLAACENKNQNDMQVSETASLKSVSETTVSESNVSEISETSETANKKQYHQKMKILMVMILNMKIMLRKITAIQCRQFSIGR